MQRGTPEHLQLQQAPLREAFKGIGVAYTSNVQKMVGGVVGVPLKKQALPGTVGKVGCSVVAGYSVCMKASLPT